MGQGRFPFVMELSYQVKTVQNSAWRMMQTIDCYSDFKFQIQESFRIGAEFEF